MRPGLLKVSHKTKVPPNIYLLYRVRLEMAKFLETLKLSAVSSMERNIPKELTLPTTLLVEAACQLLELAFIHSLIF